MNKEKVLVVDDDESVLEYLATALSLDHYDVEAVSSPQDALAKITSAAVPYPVALFDLMMPGMDGLELLRRIRTESPDTIVIMMTAHSSMDTAVRALNDGAFAYLSKPVVVEEMRAKIKNAFDKFHLIEKNRALIRDLSAEKEYNECVLRNLVYTVVATDAEGRIKKTNKAMEALLGYTESELSGQPLSVILAPVNQTTTWNDLKQKNMVTNFPLVFRTKSGADIAVLFTGTIMRDEQGKMVGFLGTAKP